jgi:hypothetical protein
VGQRRGAYCDTKQLVDDNGRTDREHRDDEWLFYVPTRGPEQLAFDAGYQHESPHHDPGVTTARMVAVRFRELDMASRRAATTLFATGNDQHAGADHSSRVGRRSLCMARVMPEELVGLNAAIDSVAACSGGTGRVGC